MLLPMLSFSEHVMRCKVNDMRDISALEKVYTILSFPYFKNLDSVCTCLRIGALQLGHAIRAYHGHLTDLRKTIFIRRPVENGAMSHSTGHGRVGNKASPQVVFHDDEGLPVT